MSSLQDSWNYYRLPKEGPSLAKCQACGMSVQIGGGHHFCGTETQPVGWLESPHGQFRANPLFRMTGPQTLAWSYPMYLPSSPPALGSEPATVWKIDWPEEQDEEPSYTENPNIAELARKMGRTVTAFAALASPPAGEKE